MSINRKKKITSGKFDFKIKGGGSLNNKKNDEKRICDKSFAPIM